MGTQNPEPALKEAVQSDPTEVVQEGRPRGPKISRTFGRKFGSALLGVAAIVGVSACAVDGNNKNTNNQPGPESCDGLDRFDPLCGVRLDPYENKGNRILVFRAINKATPEERVDVNITTFGEDGLPINSLDFVATTPDVQFELGGNGVTSATVTIGDNEPVDVNVAPVTNF